MGPAAVNCLCLLIFIVICASTALSSPPKPGRNEALVDIPLYAPVTDLTKTLTQGDIAGLQADIAALQAKNGAQIAVLMIPNTLSELMEEFALRTFDSWYPGHERVKDRVLIIVAKDDLRMRIVVSTGLKDIFSPAVTDRIINEQFLSLFRQGKFAIGLANGLKQIIRVIEGEPLPPRDGRWALYDEDLEAWALAVSGGIVVICLLLRFKFSALTAASLAAINTFSLFLYTATDIAITLFLAITAALLTFLPSDAIFMNRRGASAKSSRKNIEPAESNGDSSESGNGPAPL